jgi:hypothetical protein
MRTHAAGSFSRETGHRLEDWPRPCGVFFLLWPRLGRLLLNA